MQSKQTESTTRMATINLTNPITNDKLAFIKGLEHIVSVDVNVDENEIHVEIDHVNNIQLRKTVRNLAMIFPDAPIKW